MKSGDKQVLTLSSEPRLERPPPAYLEVNLRQLANDLRQLVPPLLVLLLLLLSVLAIRNDVPRAIQASQLLVRTPRQRRLFELEKPELDDGAYEREVEWFEEGGEIGWRKSDV